MLALLLLLAAAPILARPILVEPIEASAASERISDRGGDLYLFGAAGPGAFGQPGTNATGYDFEGVEPAGWAAVPPPAPDAHWHVEDVSLVAGHGTDIGAALPFDVGDTENSYALWCGVDDPGYITPPGYGDNWDVAVEVDVGLAVATSATVDFYLANHYEGLGYDYFTVEVLGTAGTWLEVYRNDDEGPEAGRPISLAVATGDVGGYLDKVRFHFQSDPGFSDEDGNLPTDIGAAWVDNVLIQVDAVPAVQEDFEDGLLPPGFTLLDLAAAYSTTELYDGVHIADPCWDDTHSAWGFFDPSTPSGAYPDGVVAYGPPYAWMVLESPVLERDQLGGQLEYVYGTTGLQMELDAFVDLPLNALIFFSYSVSARVAGGVFGPWEESSSYTYTGSPFCNEAWLVGIEPEAAASSGPGTLTGLMVRVILHDMYPVWGDLYGDGTGHTVGLLIDGVSLHIPGDGEPIDFGDAPDPTYPTLLANDGARHAIVPGYFLGAAVDGEADGQPTPPADGDDLSGVPDDEDGVVFGPLQQGLPATVTVTASMPGMLNAWLDFNADGDWADPGEQIFLDTPLVAGANALGFAVPGGANLGLTYARFRYNVIGGLSYTGFAEIGEVEDHIAEILPAPPEPEDFGDAPDPTYPTLLASNGARHTIVPGFFLGASVDAEPDGQPTVPADGDDLNGVPDDEDGVVFGPLQQGMPATVTVTASLPGLLNAWLDFNADGDWADPGEQIFVDTPLAAGANALGFVVPASANLGPTYARFRYNDVGGLTYTGPADNGEVEDYVAEIMPGMVGNVIITPDSETIALVDGPLFQKEFVCQYLGGGSGPVYGYSIEVSYDGGIVGAAFAKPDNGPFATAPLFFVTPVAGGARIDAALGDTGVGIASGELFKATITGTGCGTSALALTLHDFRDDANQPLSGFFGVGGQVQVDMVAPTVTNEALTRINLPDNGYAKDGDDLQITADFADGCGDFAGLTITADLSDLIVGGGAAVAPAATADPTATWTLSGADLTAPDGTKTVTLAAVDALGNAVSTTVSIIVDNTAPAAVSNLTAAPGHEKVEVGWTHDGSDVNRYWVYRGMWYDTTPGVTAYPEYDDLTGDVIPARPVAGGLPDPGQGWVRVDADDLGPAIDSFFDVFVDFDPLDPPRGIFWYEVFATDLAGNASDPAATSDRATNYWLGDINGDGYVTSGDDITPLAASYGLGDDDGGYNNECDVGPTDDFTGVGIPATDDWIGFEDLMIFALNYGQVGPLPVFQEGATDAARIAWSRVAEDVWSLVLERPCADLKGLSLRAQVEAGSVIAVEPGALCSEQPGQVFLRNVDAHGLDAGLALLGRELRIVGQGELLRVTFAEGVVPGEIELDLRDGSNQPVGLELESSNVPEELPEVYALAQNFPNPFNPKTSIRFDLPAAQSVRLSVFALDGRRVITLVDAAMPAGHHAVDWNGRDEAGQPVASGIYLYRIEAGPLQRTNKMLMLR